MRDSSLLEALSATRVAIFGASASAGKWGYIVPEQLLAQGFRGEVILVNPRGGEAFGLPLQRPEAAAGAQLAIAVTPAGVTPQVAQTCGELGIGVLVVGSAGFREAGNPDLEVELVGAALAGGVRIVGPNCLGPFVGPSGLNLSTLPGLPVGHVSFISQSGGMALQVAHRLRQLGGGFDVMLSLGNKADIGVRDALEAAASRDGTESILLYLERLDEGNELLDQIETVSRSVPVVTLLGGRTSAGRGAAQSHTGSILRRWDRAAAVLSDSGAVVETNLGLATAAAAGARRRQRRDRRDVFVLVDGGGHSVLFADALTEAGYALPAPADGAGPWEGGAATNPLDLAGAADDNPMLFAELLEQLLRNGAYDAIVLGGIFGGYGTLFGEHLAAMELRAAERIAELAGRASVPIILQSAYAADVSPALDVTRRAGVQCVEWPEEAAAILRAWGPPPTPIEPLRSSSLGAAGNPAARAPQPDDELAAHTRKVVACLDARGIEHAVGSLIDRGTLGDVKEGRWVLRADGYAHKVDAGAIELDVPAAELMSAYDRLTARLALRPEQERVRIAPMVAMLDELVVTFWRDRTEGDGWAIGAGGGRVEQLADVAVGRPPRRETDVAELLATTRRGRAISRGHELGGLPAFVLRLAQAFYEDLTDLRELECNPVALAADGPVILDVLPDATDAP